jgi:hypothetical protein
LPEVRPELAATFGKVGLVVLDLFAQFGDVGKPGLGKWHLISTDVRLG